jgi:Skp family chaperone for outer membrane proteins
MGFAVWLSASASALAEARKPGEQMQLGAADVDLILRDYWRTSRVKAELERHRTSREFRQKQEEVERLERELSAQRFAYFRDRRVSSELRKMRGELRKMAEEEAGRAREREKEAIKELLVEVRQSAESIGRQSEHIVIFDSNTPHILFMTNDPGKVEDLTDATIENLNSRQFTR